MSPSLYASLLGPSWASLSTGLKWLHQDATRATGRFRVRRGEGRLARMFAALCALPAAGDEVSVTLDVERIGDSERWTRTFAGRRLRTSQWSRGRFLVEAFRGVLCVFRLRIDGPSLVFEQTGAAVGTRRVALPLPRLLAPSIEARSIQDGTTIRVDVRLRAPWAGLLVAYDGFLTIHSNPRP